MASLAVLFGAAAHANTETLRIATGDYAPYTEQSAPGGGIVNDFVQQVGQTAGFDIEFDYMPWMRGLELTRSGRYDAASFWFYNEDREADFIHVGPVSEINMVLFRRQDTDLPDWTGIHDLADVRLGAVTGYTYTPDFWERASDGRLTVETAQTDAANLRKLVAGRIDAYPMSKAAGLALIDALFTGEDRASLTMEDRPLHTTDGFLLVPRKMEGAEEVAARLQNAVDQLGIHAADRNN
ncbi:MAG: transporter substrate-binding domain-containing protein [Pseudomonadota bacterium]